MKQWPAPGWMAPVPFPSRIPGLKICGVTLAAEAERLANLGVDALGVNFWPLSNRFVNPASAAWLAPLAGRIARVGVFGHGPDETPLLTGHNRGAWELGRQVSRRLGHLPASGLEPH